MSVSLADLLPNLLSNLLPNLLANLLANASWSSSSGVILDRFLEYAAGRRLTLYRALEEAILEFDVTREQITATRRSRPVSCARITSPMPPAPSGDRIW